MTKLAEILLPIRTKNPLNMSQGITRAGMFARAKERKQQRYLASLAVSPGRVRLQDALLCGPLEVHLTRIAPSSGLDDDALPASMKSIRDGVADAMGFTTDRHPLLLWKYAQARGKDYAVKVEIFGERP